MDQRERADKIEPTLAAEPIENAEASEPTDPIDRIEPAEPIDRIEPNEPIDKIDPLDPVLKTEPEGPGERDEPAEIRITTFWQAGNQPTSRAECCKVAPSRRRSPTERQKSEPVWLGVPALRRFEKRPGFG